MKLYYSPKTCALVPLLALEEVGAEFELVSLDFSKEEQKSAEFLQINPLARVPVLVTDCGSLSEVPAILSFIAKTYPRANLSPADDFATAKLHSFNAFMSSTVHIAIAHFVRPYVWADDSSAKAAMQAKAPENYKRLFDIIENRLFTGPWVLGDQFTTADPYLFHFARLLERVRMDLRDYVQIHRHFENMNQRPAVRRALEIENELAHAH
jgi:glutathione S-transferase